MPQQTSLLTHYAVSDLGKARANNEDYYLADPHGGFFILADGIGGHSYGEVAAKLACECVHKTFSLALENNPPQDIETATALLKFAIYNANRHVLQTALATPIYKGMGTTLIVAFIHKEHLLIAHVGDSRCYCLESSLVKLTEDHTLFVPKSPKSRSLRGKHFLTKSIGLKNYIEPSLTICPYDPASTYLLCSDGLSDYLHQTHIETILKSDHPLETQGAHLLNAALNTAAKDNITFILIKSLYSQKEA